MTNQIIEASRPGGKKSHKLLDTYLGFEIWRLTYVYCARSVWSGEVKSMTADTQSRLRKKVWDFWYQEASA
jgi:hypothetical protein